MGGGGLSVKGEFILPGFSFRGCLTKFVASVSATGVEVAGAFVLMREVREVGAELRAMLLKRCRDVEEGEGEVEGSGEAESGGRGNVC